jgi:mono/diheme cytochrome c family protein
MLYAKTSFPSLESGPAGTRSTRARWLGTALALTGVFTAGCSGGSGADVEQNPGTGPTGPTSNYNGPAPSTPDVQQFKINLWDNIEANNRCGTCHSDTGGQAPMFARRDDINLAYAAANGVVALSAPQDSTMVTKVGAGHNCWLSSDAACGSILTTWITNWAGSLASTAARKIELEPPVLRPPGQSKNFPADQGALFLTTVYPLLEQHCSDCHASDTALKQQPFFAEGPPSDLLAVASAYEAAKSKMDLDDPSLSRYVVRLRNEFHNCWRLRATSLEPGVLISITRCTRASTALTSSAPLVSSETR